MLTVTAYVQVEMVVVGDDCALPHSRLVGRRGIAGTVLVHKVLNQNLPKKASRQTPSAASVWHVTAAWHNIEHAAVSNLACRQAAQL